ncbi:hypothetical protein GGU10DRAFT_387267 [Lentinula aff. detonsa]|uniref:Telomere replication protein EST3 n=1 Tax=Lentinula aff. detonsa TaxID=2804958 RepID=A0AA38NM06_9AGAR|nr:hypothetical protein GGU10DRAFT_387267 [Lentinula aff. detonsa]
MSNELRPWIQDYLMQIAETKGADLASVEWSSKVKKVQIIEFLTYGSQNGDEDSIIWARVSDKNCHIPVRFSVDATAEYRRVNQARLTQVKTALVILRKFRILHCRIPSTRTGHKLTPDAYLALECNEMRLLGSIGQPTMGNPAGIATNQDLLKYNLELRNPGGGANFLKIRAQERQQRRSAGKGKEEKNDKYLASGRERSRSPLPLVSVAAPIAGPSLSKGKVDKAKSGYSRIMDMPATTTKTKSLTKYRLTTRPQADQGKDYEREIARRFASIPEAHGLNNKQRIQYYCELFQDAGLDLHQLEAQKDKKGKGPAVKRLGLIPLSSPSEELSKGIKGLGLLNPDLFPNAARDIVRPEQAQDVSDNISLRKREGHSNKSTNKDWLHSSQRSRGSQESKFSQQQHTPRTSPQSSSPLRSQSRSPQSELLTENWSSSDRGSPHVDGDGEENNEEEGEQENDKGSSSASASPTPSRSHRLSSPLRATPSSPPNLLVEDSIHNPLPTPIPPTPAQRPRPPPTQNAVSLAAPEDDIVEMPSFDLNFSQSIKDENPSPIQVLKLTSIARLPRIPPAMPPPWLERVNNGDTAYVQQLIPESSQFRPSPPTPAQRCRDLSQTPNQSLSHPSGVKSVPSLSFPLATGRISSAATALSSPMNARFPVYRKVPPPPAPPPRDGQNSPRVLAPNSDTSGTQSQSQSQGHTNSSGQNSQSQRSGKRSDSVRVSRAVSDSRPMDVDAGKSPLFVSQSNVHGDFNTSKDDDDDHDSLFSAPDDDIAISDHLPSEADPQHFDTTRNDYLNGTIGDDSNLGINPIANASLEVHTGNSTLGAEAPSEIRAACEPAGLLTSEAADNINNVRGDVLGSTDGSHEDNSRTTSTSLEPQRSKETLKSLKSDKGHPTVLEPVAHDIEAWSLPSFLRRKKIENMRVGELQPIVKTVNEGKQKARLLDASPVAIVRETVQSSYPIATVDTARSEKRSHTDQGEAGPVKKKQKIMSEVLSERLKEKSAPPRKLDGFELGFDDIPPGELFMSWERLQSISLKVGRARTRQAQTAQRLV